MSDQTQDSSNHPEASRDYLDFKLEIGHRQGNEYPIAVDSPAGQTHAHVAFPFDEIALERYLDKLQIALLSRHSSIRRVVSDEERQVMAFGQALFDFLLSGEARNRFDVSCLQAAQQGKGLRLSLRIQPPELASLPWEFLYDPRKAEYLCLTAQTPVVRYLELPQPVQPLTVQPPLRVLGMIAAPTDRPRLDVEGEKERLEKALGDLQAQGLVQLNWLPGATWRDLQRFMRPRRGPWHIFHFIGHGGFDRHADEGLLLLENDDRTTHRLGATELARLLAGQPSVPRLVLLNACEGARGGQQDIFSGTASILVRRGLPAVLAMQYPITDRAAIELSRSFYEALADGLPVDACVAEARKAISIEFPGSLEWGTPVLYLRAADGVLFHLQPPAQASTARIQQQPANRQPLTTRVDPIAPARPPTADRQELPIAELTLELASGVPITFVRVPAGEFWMGSDKNYDPDAFDDETPLHRLFLDEYWIGKYPVTNLQYRIYVLATKSKYPLHWRSGRIGRIPQGMDQHPVVNVTWHEALDFCKWFSQRVKGYLIRLPSEAEWEKAARGGLLTPRLQAGRIAALIDNPNWQRIYPWGDEPPHKNLCNFEMKIGGTTPVGLYSPQSDSPYGCADLAGNVWEWTVSLFKSYPYQKDDGREKIDDTSVRVLRGGSFYSESRLVRCAVRSWLNPFNRHRGFRVVCSPI
ncbi:MAG: SUMF1/EgtB/PvdO family nonheme iron enzyme [Anaerolineales bacterium]|nr:SUMF1/EgtB/PvdO family nonheme iron enzyme [Anaerolineales bacterium]